MWAICIAEYHGVGKPLSPSQYLHTRNGLYYLSSLLSLSLTHSLSLSLSVSNLDTKLRVEERSANKRITKSTYYHCDVRKSLWFNCIDPSVIWKWGQFAHSSGFVSCGNELSILLPRLMFIKVLLHTELKLTKQTFVPDENAINLSSD